MGLSDADIKDLTLGWEQTMGAVQKAIVDAGGYTWSLVPGQENANASPILMTNSPCSALSHDRYYPPPPPPPPPP